MSVDERDTLAWRLRLKRREEGFTQEELGKKALTNQAVIQKLENGRSLRPRCIIELAAVLNSEPGFLMYGHSKAEKALIDLKLKIKSQEISCEEVAQEVIKINL